MLELCDIGHHGPDAVGQRRRDRDPLSEQPLQHRRHGANDVCQIDRCHREDLLATEGEQLPGQRRRTFGGRPDLAEIPADRLVGADLVGQQLRIPEDRRQHVVEVVRHTASQLSDRFHLLSLP